MKKLLFVLAVAAVAVPAASAGGFATVGLSSLPEGTHAGGTWSPSLTIKAHGRTPVDGLSPLVRIRNGSEVREFSAKPTGKTGVYRADVSFPTAGTWTYEVWDGYTQTHTYKPVEIGAPVGSFPYLPLGLAAAFALALVAGTIVYLQRRRPQLAPAMNLKQAA